MSTKGITFLLWCQHNWPIFFLCCQKSSRQKFMSLNIMDWTSKTLIFCIGAERNIHCCLNSIHSSCNMIARLTHVSCACIMRRSNFSRFFRNNAYFINCIIYSLRLSMFYFENSVFILRYLVKHNS